MTCFLAIQLWYHSLLQMASQGLLDLCLITSSATSKMCWYTFVCELKNDMKTVCCEDQSCDSVQGQLKEANAKAENQPRSCFVDAESGNEESSQ